MTGVGKYIFVLHKKNSEWDLRFLLIIYGRDGSNFDRVLECSYRALYNITSKCCLSDDHITFLLTFLILHTIRVLVFYVIFGAGVQYVSTLCLQGLLKVRNKMVKGFFLLL